MEQWGNARANLYWEANLPAHVKKPTADDNVRTVERFIRDKYELKKFVAASIPPPGASRSAAPEPVRGAAPAPAPAARAYTEEPRRQAAPAAAPVPVRAAAPDLLDFDFAPAAPAPAIAPVAHPPQHHVFGFGQQQAHVGSHSSDGFGDFSGHEHHSAPSHHAPPQPQHAPQPQHFQDPFSAPQQQVIF